MTTILTISAGAGNPSSTRKLADRLSRAVNDLLPDAELHSIDIRAIGHDLVTATTSGLRSPEVAEATASVARADAVIAVTPVFNGAYSGLFKLFLDVLDEGTLADVPVLLAATGGTARHSLAIDQTLVPLLFYLRARPLPWPVYAATDDWADPSGLDARVRQAAEALAQEVDGEKGSSRVRVQPDDDFALTTDFASMLAQVGQSG